MSPLVSFLRGLLCCNTQSTVSSTVHTRPGLLDVMPDVKVAAHAPGPVASAVTGPDEGVTSLLQKLQQQQMGADIPWRDSQNQASQQQQQHDHRVWGTATSLYDLDPHTGVRNGNPIADCFAAIAYEHGSIMSLADGVNWGERPRQAARAAVLGFCTSMHQQLSCQQGNNKLSSTEVFAALRTAVLAAQRLVLAAQGTLTTLVGAVVCPQRRGGGHLLMVVIIGDSPCYVWRADSGTVEEVTHVPSLHGFHRDPRACPGCLGYAAGEQPDLSNISYSLTHLQTGDLVFMTSDGISDNFDPVIRRLALPSALPGKSPRPSTAALTAAQAAAQAAIDAAAQDTSQDQPELAPHMRMDPAPASPATCHAWALQDMAKVLRHAADAQQQQGSQLQACKGPGTHPASKLQSSPAAADQGSLASSGNSRGLQVQVASTDGRPSRGSASGDLPAFDKGALLTPYAAVTALINFSSVMTEPHRRVLEDAAGGAGVSREDVGDILAELPGKLDHACVVAYKVGS